MLKLIYDQLDDLTKLQVRGALANPILRDFFVHAAEHTMARFKTINPNKPAEEVADEFRKVHAERIAYDVTAQFIQSLIQEQSQQK